MKKMEFENGIKTQTIKLLKPTEEQYGMMKLALQLLGK